MVAGVIAFAVAIELTIAEPAADSAWAAAATLLGGSALYLAGNVLYKRALVGGLPRSRLLRSRHWRVYYRSRSSSTG